MENIKFIVIVVFLSSIFQPVSAQEQDASGKNGQNYNQVKGDVNNQRVGTVRTTNNVINFVPDNSISNTIINKINHLVVPKKLGFSEVFYNKTKNTFYLKSHKTKKTYNLRSSTTNYNYININKTNSRNSYNKVNIVTNSNNTQKSNKTVNNYYTTNSEGDFITINNNMAIELGISYSNTKIVNKTYKKAKKDKKENAFVYSPPIVRSKQQKENTEGKEVDDF